MKNWLFMIVLLLLLTGCSKDKEETVDAEGQNIDEDSSTDGTDEVVTLPYAAPFSGERSEEEFTNRPVLVTINNHPKARPQSGLASADIVYEMVAEGNITRLLALFQSELPAEIGPVRSARDYFIDIAKGLDAFYVAHGYSPEARLMLTNGDVDNINGMQYDGTFFKRSNERVSPHNSYITGEHVIEGMKKVDARTTIEKYPSLAFYDTAQDVPLSALASIIDVRYGSNEDFHHMYSYDTLTQQYNRTSGGTKTIDNESLEEISVANVMFFEVVHQTIDAAGRQQLDLTLGGKGYLFQAGVMKEIEWQQLDGVLVPMEDGQPAKLVPGKSWVHLVKSLDPMVTFTP
jgi:hypothetical protein